MSAKNYTTPAYVLGASVTGLAVIRNLARHGVPVFMVDADTMRPAMHSRFAKPLIAPKDEKALLSFLIDEANRATEKPVLFPTSDLYLGFVHQHRAELHRHFRFIISPENVMNLLLDKKGQYDLAVQMAIPVPKTIYPQNAADLEKSANSFHYPVFIKGLRTEIWRKRFGEIKGFVAKDRAELVKKYHDIQADGAMDTVVQEIIQGDDTCHYKICAYLDQHQNVLLSFTLQKIRQFPCRFGIGSCVESLWVPEVADLGIAFLRSIKYEGVGSIEFKRDTRDGTFKMIEVNPRFWAQNALADVCGQNFALTAYKNLIGEEIVPKSDFIEHIKWTAFKEDRASFLGYRKEKLISFGAWLKSIYLGRHIWAIWSWDDPMPFLTDIKFGFVLFEKLFKKLRQK